MNSEALTTGFQFASPGSLYLLAAIPALMLLFALYSYRKDKLIANNLKTAYSPRQYIALGILWSLVLTGVVGVLANPRLNTYGVDTNPIYGDYVFLVDTSLSMGARPSLEDNSRIETAREIMADTFNKTPARFLVYGYAGMAEPLSGFISDQGHLNEVITHGVYVDMFPSPGSGIVHALARVAHEKQENPGYENVTHVVLFSDGKIDTEYNTRKLSDALDKVRNAGLSVVVVGLGSNDQERVPFFDREGVFTGEYYKVRETGEHYTAHLYEDNLRRIADGTGGAYFHESRSEDLAEYLHGTLQDEPIFVEDDISVLNSKSLAYIFAIVSFIAFAMIAANSRKFYR